MAAIPSLTELTNQINRYVPRETRLALLRRAGVASRSQGADVPPVAIIGMFLQRLEKGAKPANLLNIPNGKLVKLGRAVWIEWHRPTGGELVPDLADRIKEALEAQGSER